MKHYWGYRIDVNNASFFWNELQNGRLRQGWGYDNGQDLNNMTVDEGAGRNRRMLDVKKGDILLVPRIHRWDEVSIVEATEDWDKGYRFEIDEKLCDYGHIFPARCLRHFKRNSPIITGEVRSSLHNPMRFWNMDYYSKSIDAIVESDQDKLLEIQSLDERFKSTIIKVYESLFDSNSFSSQLFDIMCKQFSRDEWEYALIAGLKLLYPKPYFRVERTGGVSECLHGTDITVSFKSIVSETEYVIAIQVKDYEGFVSGDVISQINKASEYFKEQNKVLVDKIVIITKAQRDDNHKLLENCGDVKIIFANELKTLLSLMGRQYISEGYLNVNRDEDC